MKKPLLLTQKRELWRETFGINNSREPHSRALFQTAAIQQHWPEIILQAPIEAAGYHSSFSPFPMNFYPLWQRTRNTGSGREACTQAETQKAELVMQKGFPHPLPLWLNFQHLPYNQKNETRVKIPSQLYFFWLQGLKKSQLCFSKVRC